MPPGRKRLQLVGIIWFRAKILRTRAEALTLRHLVLLPGLDGTGELFADFIAALPHTLTAKPVAYPRDRSMSYTDLLPIVAAAAPHSEPFALVAESFSTPVALAYASTCPPNLRALIICAGFVSNPVGNWSEFAKGFVRPWLFKLTPPRLILEHFLVGANAPTVLIQQVRRVLKSVAPEVLSSRVQSVLACDAKADLVGTKVPLVYLLASHDRLVSAFSRKEISRLRPDIVLASIAAPHMLLQREPQKAANLIATYVQQFNS